MMLRYSSGVETRVDIDRGFLMTVTGEEENEEDRVEGSGKEGEPR